MKTVTTVGKFKKIMKRVLRTAEEVQRYWKVCKMKINAKNGKKSKNGDTYKYMVKKMGEYGGKVKKWKKG